LILSCVDGVVVSRWPLEVFHGLVGGEGGGRCRSSGSGEDSAPCLSEAMKSIKRATLYLFARGLASLGMFLSRADARRCAHMATRA